MEMTTKYKKKRQFSYLPQFHKKLFLARNGDLKDFFKFIVGKKAVPCH